MTQQKRTALDTSGRPRVQISGLPAGRRMDYALRYAELGWLVFPCHAIHEDGACTCREADCASPGKHPIRQLVQDGLKSATRNAALIKAWWGEANAPWANIAVRTGPESGFWVLDVDPQHGGEASLDSLLTRNGRLPETAEAITGGGGRHILFRYPAGRRVGSSTNKLGPGLDIRGEGGYIIVEPSLHISGQGYAWEGSSDPLEGVALAAAPEWILGLIEAPASGQRSPGQPPTGQMIPPEQVLELRQALGYLDVDDYHTWVQVGMALHSSGAPNAFGLWNEWSIGSDKYSAEAMRPKWATFRDHPNGVGLTSIFSWAQELGWVNPATREAQQFRERFEAKTGLSVEDLNRATPKQEIKAPVAESIIPFPITGLNEVCAWMEAQAPISYPVVTQHAVLSLIGAVAARRYVTAQGDPLSLYLGASADSVGEIRYAHHGVYLAMELAGLRRLVRNTRITSPTSLYRSLLRAPALLYQSDDYGGLTAFARRQPSGQQEAVLSLFAQLWDGKSLPLDHADEAGLKTSSLTDEQPVLQAPALSLFALIGQDHLATLLRTSELGRGAMEQILMAITDPDDAVTREPSAREAPVWMSEYLRAIRGTPKSTDLDCASIFQGNALLQPTQTTVSFSGTSTAYYARLDGLSAERRLRPVLLAARGIVRRIAALLAVWHDPHAPRVDGLLLEWSVEYVAARLQGLIDQHALLAGSDGKLSIYDQVLTRVTEAKAKGLAERDLISSCWAFRNLSSEDRTKLITQMIQDQAIVEIATTNKTGPKGKRLVASKLVVRKG